MLKFGKILISGLILICSVGRADASVNIKPAVINNDVPFTAQAPYGEWSDARQQDACEEASSLIAVSWATKADMNQTKAKKIILAMAAWEQKNYGNYQDTSAADTLQRLIKNYFNYQNAELKNNITINDIIVALNQGAIVIAPTNGRLLHNPHFKSPVRERHMVVIIGYNNLTKKFITNDPGTKYGQGYQYLQTTLFNAIRDYPTGHHAPIKKVAKNIIVVRR